MNSYVAGDVVECFTNPPFTDEDSGNPVDPSTVTFRYAIAPTPTGPLGPLTSIPYSGASTPAVGVCARLSTGVYESWIDTTGAPGWYIYEFISTGTGQARQFYQFYVAPSPL